MTEGGPNVIVVEDDEPTRLLLDQILTAAGYSVTLFCSGEEFFNQARPVKPTCVLLDLQLPGISGMDIQKRIHRLGWILSIIFMTSQATVSTGVEAMKAGAVDFLLKPIKPALVLETVEKALVRAREIQRLHREQGEIKALFAQLTEREVEVLSWVIAGKLNKQIASILGITERTVKAHRANFMDKLGVTSVVALVRIADRAGLRPGTIAL